MDHYGLVSLLPPLVAIALALYTKQVVISLGVGAWVGATIIAGGNPLVGITELFSEYFIPGVADSYNAGLIILILMAGGFVSSLHAAGASHGLEGALRGRITTRRGAQNLSWFGNFAFFFSEGIIALGAIMRPITDRLRVSRVKLAYILDSMGCNFACQSPFTSYFPFLVGVLATQLDSLGLPDDPMGLFFRIIPYNAYAIFAMLLALFVANTGMDIGAMYRAERRAIDTGETVGTDEEPVMDIGSEEEGLPEGYEASIWNFLVPIVSLFVCLFATVFYTGDIVTHGFREAFVEADITLAITLGFLGGSVGAAVHSIVTHLQTYKDAVDEWLHGVRQIFIVPLILVLAWAIGDTVEIMGIGQYLTEVVEGVLAPGWIPAIIFAASAVIAFSTGSSWGTFALMMPIAFPMADALGIYLPLAVAPVIGGGLMGDHCSPISDTTIMASGAAACDHIEHVRTQFPYALIVGAAAVAGYLVATFSAIPILLLPTTLVVLGALLVVLYRQATKTPIDYEVEVEDPE